MLILTRRPNESIMIGDQIVITVLEIRGQQVKLGFDAPQDIAIHRQEVFEKVQQEKAKNEVSEEESE